MFEVIIVLAGLMSLYLGYRLGFTQGFKRMGYYAQAQVGCFADTLLKDGRYTEDELRQLSKQSVERYLSLIEQYKKNNT